MSAPAGEDPWPESVGHGAAEADPTAGERRIGDLADRLRLAREQRGLSYREAAEQIGCPTSSVHNIEHGGDPRWSTVQRVLAWLDRIAPATPDAGDASERCRCTAQGGGVYDAQCPLHAGSQEALAASTSASEPLSEDEKAQGRPWYDLDNQPHYEFSEEAVERILAAREAKVRAEAGEQIAQAIEADLAAWNALGTPGAGPQWFVNRAMQNAARIAREVTR